MRGAPYRNYPVGPSTRLVAVLLLILVGGAYKFGKELNKDIRYKKEMIELEKEKLKLEIELKKLELSKNGN